jgi:hypothetical protein
MKKPIYFLSYKEPFTKDDLMEYLDSKLPIDLKPIEDMINSVMEMNPYVSKMEVILVLKYYFSILRDEIINDGYIYTMSSTKRLSLLFSEEDRTFDIVFPHSPEAPASDYL